MESEDKEGQRKQAEMTVGLPKTDKQRTVLFSRRWLSVFTHTTASI